MGNNDVRKLQLSRSPIAGSTIRFSNFDGAGEIQERPALEEAVDSFPFGPVREQLFGYFREEASLHSITIIIFQNPVFERFRELFKP